MKTTKANFGWAPTAALLSLKTVTFTGLPTSPFPSAPWCRPSIRTQDGTLWFGTNRGLVSLTKNGTKLFTVNEGLATDDVRVILQTRAGDLLVGGYGGLTRIREGHFSHWTERDGLPSDNIRSLYEDNDGAVWIGTYDGGLGRFKNGAFTRFTMRDGLYDNGVFQILEDGAGSLWMSCNRGIYRVKKQELNDFADGRRSTISSIAYGKVDGMATVECNGGLSPAGVKTRDGKLWFPTQAGVAVVDPAAVSYNPHPPPVVIESIVQDRTPVRLTESIRLPRVPRISRFNTALPASSSRSRFTLSIGWRASTRVGSTLAAAVPRTILTFRPANIPSA